MRCSPWFFICNRKLSSKSDQHQAKEREGRETMRSPSILAQCLPSLLSQERRPRGVSVVPEREVNVPSPAVEILPAKNAHTYKYAGENVDFQSFKIFKGRYSVADIIGFTSKSEMSPSKYDGSLKSWESSVDLVNVLKNEVRDGLLNFRGKRVLELSCSYGLPGICACFKGASTVHFQDINAETLRITTIPNVLANLEEARELKSRQVESPLTPSRQFLAPEVRFYAGDWKELPTVLSVVQTEDSETSQEDCVDRNSLSSSRRSRKMSGSQAWERGSDVAVSDDGGGYDVILINEIPSSSSALRRLYALIKKCLRPPYGVVYVSTKKNFVGLNSGARQLRTLVDEEGIFGAHLITEVADREVWKFFLK